MDGTFDSDETFFINDGTDTDAEIADMCRDIREGNGRIYLTGTYPTLPYVFEYGVQKNVLFSRTLVRLRRFVRRVRRDGFNRRLFAEISNLTYEECSRISIEYGNYSFLVSDLCN